MDPKNAENRAFFDSLAEGFGARYGKNAAFEQRRALFVDEARRALETLPQGRTHTCVDAGCGPGVLSVGIAQLGFAVQGCDVSGGMIAEARTRAQKADLGPGSCAFTESDLAGFLSAQPKPADLVVSSSVLEYLEDPRAGLLQLVEQVAPGGTLLVSLPNPRSLLRRLEPLAQRFVRGDSRYRHVLGGALAPEEAIALATSRGLKLERQVHFGFPQKLGFALQGLSGADRVGTLTLLVLRRRASRPLHIVVNATSARLGGGITVLKNLLPALTQVDEGKHTYTVIAARESIAALELHHPRVQVRTPKIASQVPARVLWEQLGLPLEARGADVLFSPASVGVLRAPVPQVLMFQNLAPFDPRLLAHLPLRHKARFLALRQLGRISAQASQRVVFLSEHAREVTTPQLGISTSLVRRIELGRDVTCTPEAALQAGPVLTRLGLTRPYVLCVSHFYFYKNLLELVDAFARARPGLPPGTLLALAGAPSDESYAAEVKARVGSLGLTEHVRLLGPVPSADLPALYAASELFVFPSTCESFPNILVEAMASGAPTLSSKLGPMPEIAGDGADYVDPFDVEAMARELVRLLNDPAARESLRQRGLQRAAQYSWERSARALLQVLEEVGQ
ncbi:MAG: glycosyltransferase [Deltaproteobacteria bacterium]|nr:glycosyltransferase [Deltaproteobacteria bacterium]